jgi:hypothetical protein
MFVLVFPFILEEVSQSDIEDRDIVDTYILKEQHCFK